MFTAMLMFFLMCTALAPRIPLVLIASNQFVSFCPAPGVPPLHAVVFMYIRAAIHPAAPPWPVVYENAMSAPVKPAVSPAPGAKKCSDRYPEPKPDRATDEKPRPRPSINHQRVVIRHGNELWICRHDFNFRTTTPDYLSVRPQISKVPGLLPHSLHRVHHVLALGEKRISQVRRPVHVRSHHVQYRGERQHRLDTGVPRQAVFVNSIGELGAP